MNVHEDPNLKKNVILIVDDDPINLRLLRSILEPRGYMIITALTAREAFELLMKERPELILLDVVMPVMDGFQAARKIRQSPDLNGIPIIFLTARNEKENIVEGFNAGGVDYVTKPFNPPELLARIRTHIELKQAREEILTLRGIVPICSQCKKIRDIDGSWHRLEAYISAHTKAEFTHGLCPDCTRNYYSQTTGLSNRNDKKD